MSWYNVVMGKLIFGERFLHALSFSPQRRVRMFRAVPPNEQGALLLHVSSRVRASILESLEDAEILSLLHYIDFDKAALVLRGVSDRRRKRLVHELKEETREKVDFLLRFRPETAAALMDLDYVLVDVGATFRTVRELLEAHERETGKTPAILVVGDGFLVGELPLFMLVSRRPSQVIDRYVKKVPHVRYDASESRVLKEFRRHPHSKVVVLDDDRSVLGVIYSHDLLALIDRRRGDHLYGFAGVRHEEDVFDSVWTKVRNRYKWLMLNLGTVLLAALVIGFFEDTLSRFVFLVAYMPVIAGMGGNAGMQALAVMVRGLTNRRISMQAGIRIAVREVFAGIINGVITGSLVAIAAALLHQTPMLGVVVMISVIVNLVIAGACGTIVPLFMQRLGKDPATSASIFITTATDVVGFFVFLGLARLLLV
jgi:magnesium transporter